MPPWTQVLFVYFVFISLVSIGITVYDKIVSKHRGIRRVSEATLLLFSVLGGSAAMLVTMLLIRHKTKKPKFMVGIPVILLIQAALIGLVLWRISF